MPKFKEPIYVASRASVQQRSAMWRDLRGDGWKINSSWIDEAGEDETADFTDLWDRIMREIAAARKLVFYAEATDFPLKGAILEAGIALGMGKPVIACLPGVQLEGRTFRPFGSWIKHRNVIRCDSILDAMDYHALSDDAENVRLRNALEFYADPSGKTDVIPDFYSELDFGSVAQQALEK